MRFIKLTAVSAAVLASTAAMAADPANNAQGVDAAYGAEPTNYEAQPTNNGVLAKTTGAVRNTTGAVLVVPRLYLIRLSIQQPLVRKLVL